MFNDLNNINEQSRQQVDDIFAETDKTPESGLPSESVAPSVQASPNSEIETQKIGLNTMNETVEDNQDKSGGKWFKIILILIIIAIIGLGGYLVYSKFLVVPEVVPEVNKLKDNNPSVKEDAGSFVPLPGEEINIEISDDQEIVSDSSELIPEIPGVNAPVIENEQVIPDVISEEFENSVSMPTIDSDGDGLTDAEEEIAGTNINVIDTDNDGLSDYEEVKIYKTNPLNSDTDGDGYSDGEEVNGGYNPNGPGKLSDLSAVAE